MKPLTILSVLAHPDDESFGMGGTLALYAMRGAKVHLICATRGEVGDVPPGFLNGKESIADLRESELRCAAGILGLESVQFLDYRDSGMAGSSDNHNPRALAAQPVEDVARLIVAQIRKLQPDIVLTFDPMGGYQHPDHIAIHRATVRAFKLAGDAAFSPDLLPVHQPGRLFFHTMPSTIIKTAVWILPLLGKDPHKFGANGDIDLSAISKMNYPTHVRVNIRPVIAKKRAAGACHASQGGGRMGGGILSLLFQWLGRRESFMQEYPQVTGRRLISGDLDY